MSRTLACDMRCGHNLPASPLVMWRERQTRDWCHSQVPYSIPGRRWGEAMRNNSIDGRTTYYYRLGLEAGKIAAHGGVVRLDRELLSAPGSRLLIEDPQLPFRQAETPRLRGRGQHLDLLAVRSNGVDPGPLHQSLANWPVGCPRRSSQNDLIHGALRRHLAQAEAGKTSAR